MNTELQIRTSIGSPTNNVQWNDVCKSNGNLQQSTFYDAVQAYFRQHPVYVEIWQNDNLIGGSKFYVYVPGKFTRFTTPFGKYLLQAGESILKDNASADEVIPLIMKGFIALLKNEEPVWYYSYGYFDHPDYLIYPANKIISNQSVFANAFVSLDKSIDQLWENVHPHHQHKISMAQKKGYVVEQSGDVKLFLGLLAKTYDNQTHSGPNPAFISAFYRIMEAEGIARLYVAHKGGKPVSASLITSFGKVAYYAFGGNERNNDGASHLLHWEMMKSFASKGFLQYYLGQVSDSPESGDQKFQTGISPFKRRFGTQEVSSSRKTFIFKPYSYKLWKLISPLAGTR